MSGKRYLGGILVCMPIILILISVAFLLNKYNGASADKEDWTNIAEVSDGFLDKYFDDYEEMRKEGEPEDILMVTSKTRPETYGAVNIVEAPNHLYILQYKDSVSRDVAFDNLSKDGAIVEKNQIYTLMDNVVGAEKRAMTKERTYQTMATDEEGEYLSWGIYAMELDELLKNMGELSELPTVTVAVIDSGMDQTDFEKYFPDRTLSYHCVVECSEGMVDGATTKHGTHVGGTVTEGTLDNVNLLVIKATLDAEGRLSNADVITAINYAVSQGVDVINMSIGGPGFDTAMDNALQAAEDAGIINVASAGNANVDTLYYPASYDNTFSIAALQVCDEGAECVVERWTDSNYGSKIDYAAPGGLILGINGYYMSGTSMASPHMAALAANLKSLNKSLNKNSVAEIFSKYSIDFGDEGWDQYYGLGMPNFGYIPGFCTERDCDEYGVFASDWVLDTDGLINPIETSAVDFRLRNNNISITSLDYPVTVIAESDGVFTRLEPVEVGEDEMRRFDFTGFEPGYTAIHMEYVGDVNTNGKVNLSDSLLIDYSRLSTSNPNYAPLTDYQKAVADVNKSGSVNLADSLLINYSRLSKTNVNYRMLDW